MQTNTTATKRTSVLAHARNASCMARSVPKRPHSAAARASETPGMRRRKLNHVDIWSYVGSRGANGRKVSTRVWRCKHILPRWKQL